MAIDVLIEVIGATSTTVTAPDVAITPGTRYTVEVAAVNASGQGPYSTPITVITLPSTPSTPTVSGSITQDSIPISWAANPAGEDVYRYRIYVKKATDASFGSPSGEQASTSGTVTGLLPNTAYDIAISAINSANPSVQAIESPKSGALRANTLPAAPTEYTLTTSVSPAGAGTVTLNPVGGTYASGTTVTVSYTANAGYSFAGWTLDGLGAGGGPTLLVTMTNNRSVIASFVAAPVTYLLNLVSSPTGSGSVAANPVKARYSAGDVITLTATANSGYIFSNWLGLVPATLNPVSFEMPTGDTTITAVFNTITYTLTASVNPGVGGTITANPVGPTYPSGTLVTLTATPASGYKFDNWNVDGGSNSNISIQVMMNANHSVVANFSEVAPPPPTKHNVNITISGGGSTSPSGVQQVNDGSSLTITATPLSGYEFSHWEGNVSGTTNPLTIPSVTSDMSVIAVFEKIPTYRLTATSTAGGHTSPTSGTYEEGDAVSVSAIPDTGYLFSHWTEGGASISEDNPVVILMDGDRSIQAVFEPAVVPPGEFVVSISYKGNGSTNPPVGSYTVEENTSYTVSATPASGWNFKQWETSAGAAVSSASTYNFIVHEDVSLVAVFEQPTGGGTSWTLPAIIGGVAILGLVLSSRGGGGAAPSYRAVAED